MATRLRPYERRCESCSGACVWAEDAWVCKRCGDEWYPDHDPDTYAPPGAATPTDRSTP